MPDGLTDKERALAALAALDVLQAATTGSSMDGAGQAARSMARVVLEELTPEQTASAMASLAVMAAYDVPRPVAKGQVPQRMARIRQWLPGVRLEWTWAAS